MVGSHRRLRLAEPAEQMRGCVGGAEQQRRAVAVRGCVDGSQRRGVAGSGGTGPVGREEEPLQAYLASSAAWV